MALVQCNHCGKDITNKQDKCFFCGKEISNELKSVKYDPLEAVNKNRHIDLSKKYAGLKTYKVIFIVIQWLSVLIALYLVVFPILQHFHDVKVDGILDRNLVDMHINYLIKNTVIIVICELIFLYSIKFNIMIINLLFDLIKKDPN